MSDALCALCVIVGSSPCSWGDSPALVSAASRTRARSRALLRILREIGGLALAIDSAFTL
eukprot:4417702-Pyramimonas_sp.AAC.1